MERFDLVEGLEESFQRFERAAAKGHEESIWIGTVVKGLKMEKAVLKEAFGKTEDPLGWYLAGQFSEKQERFDFWKKSAEGGCSWGQVEYGWFFKVNPDLMDLKVSIEWIEKSVKQNNPLGTFILGDMIGENGDYAKTLRYFQAAAELGWNNAMTCLTGMYINGQGCERDLRRALIWSAQSEEVGPFWDVMARAKDTIAEQAETSNGNFDQLCFLMGWGMYWYRHGSKDWEEQEDDVKAFASECLDFYCSTIELQQKSIFTFLLFWNQTVGVKDVGVLIGKIVWEEEQLVWLDGLWTFA
jgi:hypothetical protein